MLADEVLWFKNSRHQKDYLGQWSHFSAIISHNYVGTFLTEYGSIWDIWKQHVQWQLGSWYGNNPIYTSTSKEERPYYKDNWRWVQTTILISKKKPKKGQFPAEKDEKTKPTEPVMEMDSVVKEMTELTTQLAASFQGNKKGQKEEPK